MAAWYCWIIRRSVVALRAEMRSVLEFLRNGHSHAMDVSEIDEAKLHACNGQNITNMTFIGSVIRQPLNKAECPTSEIYPLSILYNSELYGNLPRSVTVREPPPCRRLAQVRSREGQNDGLTWIKPVDNRAPFQVSCKGGWVLVQKRTSSSVSFYRNFRSPKCCDHSGAGDGRRTELR